MHFAHRLRSNLPAIAWLVLALVWAPLVGQWHQVAHAGPPAQAHNAAGAAAGGNHAHSPAVAFTSSFLADHAPVDCLLLDQLALGDASPGGAVQVLPGEAPAQTPRTRPAQHPPAQPFAPFQARGPPAAGVAV